MKKESKTKPSKNWNWFEAQLRTKLLIVAALLAALYLGFFVYAFFWQGVNILSLHQLGLNKYATNKAEILKNIIWTYGLLLGGAFAILGLVNAIHRTQQTDKQIDADHRRLELEQTSERRRTDADIFARSVEQLGHKEMAIRLGGLYSIENLARSAIALPRDEDNKAYLNSLLETLAAFIRMRAIIPSEETQNDDDRVATDIESSIRVIARTFPYKVRKGITDERVDLRKCYLPMLELPSGVNLQEFDFSNSKLQKAEIVSANLQGSIFIETCLKNSYLLKSNFYDCLFMNANFTGTTFKNSSLKKACIMDSTFSYTDLSEANLTSAEFLACDFQTPLLTKTILSKVKFVGTKINLEMFDAVIPNCLWDPEFPPEISGSLNSQELHRTITARTKVIKKNNLWQKHLTNLTKEE
ncbi:MAG: hypothetical protein COA43_12110 [Robiginitomaculum sp.]|nr:MAG: hypothetical protein COA43_12110 [Robiginitomaculum sp.]